MVLRMEDMDNKDRDCSVISMTERTSLETAANN